MLASNTQKSNMTDRHLWFEKYKPGQAILNRSTYNYFKRLLDIVIVIGSSPFVGPLLLLLALLVKLESPDGPVFFAQKRAGLAGKPFKMFKFRTMVPNAEAMKKDLMHLNELEWPDFKITNDPRVTKIGRFLRKTSLDELPQLVNVLIGNMTLVGPRPTDWFPKDYILWQTERFEAKPGITGLWQIMGRAELFLDNRVRLEIAHIERQCLLFDLEILFRTIPAVLKQKGAS